MLTWILLPVFVLAVMFGTEAFLQRGILALPAQERTVQLVDLAEVDLAGGSSEEEYEDEWDEEWEDEYAEEEEAYEEEEEASSGLTIPAKETAEIPYEGYIGYLTIIAPECAGQPFTLNVNGKSTEHVFYANADRDMTAVFQSAEGFQLKFASADAAIEAIEIDNTFRLNWNRMLLTGLMAAAAYLLIALRKVIAVKLEIAFLIIALAAGLYMAIGMPSNVGLNFDDHIHFGRVSMLSYGRNALVTGESQLMADTRWSTVVSEQFVHTADTAPEELLHAQAINASAGDEDAAYTQTLQFAFSDTGYVTQAAGYGLGRLLGMSFEGQFIMGRVFNMLTYVGLCYLAIRTLKRFKAVMMTIALMPTPMFISCTYSYDATINGLCFLGIALVMDAILDRETRLTWQRGLSILLCLMVGALTKIVYMPLLLLVLLLPRSKFDTDLSRIWYKVFAVVLMLSAILAMALSVNVGAATLTDSRGSAADSSGQIAFILHNPITYLGYFFAHLWQNFTNYFVTQARVSLSYVGSISGLAASLHLWLMLFTAFTDNDPDLRQNLRWYQRVVMFLVAGMVVGLAVTTMYAAFSQVGSSVISGVQGRYMIPMLPLLWMILSPDKIHNKMNKQAWHTVLSFALLGMCGLMAVQLCGQYFA